MEYIRLGNTGMKVSRLCLGCMTFGTSAWRDWVLDEAESRPFIQKALEAGINFFDTADMYSVGGSEEILGRALKDFGVPRDEVVIATKVYNRMGDKPNQAGLSRKHIMEGCDASLRRLGTDYIDLYQIHRWDYDTPIEETLEALNDLVRMGKVLYLGASSMWTWQFAKAIHISEQNGWSKFVSMQNHYNLVYREEEREMIPYCMDQGVAVIPWSPLARGFLAGNRSADKGGETVRAKTDIFAHDMYYQASDFDVVDKLSEMAARHGISNARLAVAWMLHKPGITAPIIGVSKTKHFDDLLASLDVQLSAEEIAELEASYTPHPTIGFV